MASQRMNPIFLSFHFLSDLRTKKLSDKKMAASLACNLHTSPDFLNAKSLD